MDSNTNPLMGHSITYCGHTYTVVAITTNCYYINRDGVLYIAAVRATHDNGIDVKCDSEEYDSQLKCVTRRLRNVFHSRANYDRLHLSDTMIDRIIKAASQQ